MNDWNCSREDLAVGLGGSSPPRPPQTIMKPPWAPLHFLGERRRKKGGRRKEREERRKTTFLNSFLDLPLGSS